MTTQHTFRAMGTDILVVSAPEVDAVDFEAVAQRVEAFFADEELRFSRFRVDSELSRVNAAAGRWITVSEPFADLVAFALVRAEESDGLFDPTVLGAVRAAGYDRDFDEVLAGARARLRPPVPCGRWREVELRGDRLRLPEEVGLDLGGLAKGWTVDRAASLSLEAGLPWVLVNAGGDLRLFGSREEIEVGIEDPFERGREIARLALTDGAIATSCTQRRSWASGLHHLIDPRTGAPADTGIVQATVWAGTCALAEVESKRALLGAVPPRGTPSVLVTGGGDVVTNLGPVEACA